MVNKCKAYGRLTLSPALESILRLHLLSAVPYQNAAGKSIFTHAGPLESKVSVHMTGFSSVTAWAT